MDNEMRWWWIVSIVVLDLDKGSSLIRRSEKKVCHHREIFYYLNIFIKVRLLWTTAMWGTIIKPFLKQYLYISQWDWEEVIFIFSTSCKSSTPPCKCEDKHILVLPRALSQQQNVTMTTNNVSAMCKCHRLKERMRKTTKKTRWWRVCFIFLPPST